MSEVTVEGTSGYYTDPTLLSEGAEAEGLSLLLEPTGGSLDALAELEILLVQMNVEERGEARDQNTLEEQSIQEAGERHIAALHDQADAALAQSGQDGAMLDALAALRAGDRRRLFDFVEHLCGGTEFQLGTYGQFVRGEGEQPVSNVPQSGATAMSAGGIGGKELALRVLGHPFPKDHRIVYDFAERYGLQGSNSK